MSLIFKVFGGLGVALMISLIHLFALNFFWWPWYLLNVSLLASIWAIFADGQRTAAWLSLLLGIILEPFSTSPFGAVTVSLTLSIIFLNWLLFNVFTNRSLYMVFTAGVIGVLAYRLILFLIFLGWNFFYSGELTSILPGGYVNDSLWTLLITPPCLAVLYFFSGNILKRLVRRGYAR